MPGYIRNKTRPQGDRPIIHKQDNFGQGLNVDIPASDFDNNANQNLENYIAYERYVDGRSGTVFTKTLPGTGTVHSIKIHPTENICIMHRGSAIWQVGTSDVEIKQFVNSGFVGAAPSFTIDKKSTLKDSGKNFILWTEDGIFQILIEYPNKSFFQINSGKPLDTDSSAIPLEQRPFKYKIAYTFSIIVDIATGLAAPAATSRFSSGYKLIWESAPVTNGAGSVANNAFWNLAAVSSPIGSGAGFDSVFIALGTNDLAGVESKITHMSGYITPDLGENGFNNLNISQFAFGNDAWVDHSFLSGFALGINLSDDKLKQRLTQANTRLKTAGFEELPSGDVGEITEGFLFSGIRGSKKCSYSQRVPDDTIMGFHNPATQYYDFNDGITVFAKSPDYLGIMTNKKTYTANLSQFVNAGVFESVITLVDFKTKDETIGIDDAGSFVEVEDGAYMAICSDQSVRVWDGGSWSRDLAEDRVRNIIERIQAGSTLSGYYRGAYFVWFKVDKNQASNNLCMRFTVKRDSGKGWCFYTGADFIFPGDEVGGFVGPNFFDTAQPRNDFFFAIDKSDGKLYWLETFYATDNMTIGVNNLPITKYWNDKVTGLSGSGVGTSIICKIRARDVTGERESFNIKHSESHAYLRDMINPASGTVIPNAPTSGINYPDLTVDALAFVDGSQVRVETAGKVKSDGDIQFWYRVEGSRIAIEFQTNRSGHQLVGLDSRFRVQDIQRPNKGPANTVAATFQQDMLNGIKIWLFTRPRVFIDRIRKISIPNALIGTTIGPDGRNLAVKVGVNSLSIERFRQPSKTIYSGAFTISFWVSSVTFRAAMNTVLLQFQDASGVPNFTLVAQDAVTVAILEGSGTVTVDALTGASGPANGFSQIMIVRSSISGASNVKVYQNNELKGSLTMNGVFGGGYFQAGGVP